MQVFCILFYFFIFNFQIHNNNKKTKQIKLKLKFNFIFVNDIINKTRCWTTQYTNSKIEVRTTKKFQNKSSHNLPTLLLLPQPPTTSITSPQPQLTTSTTIHSSNNNNHGNSRSFTTSSVKQGRKRFARKLSFIKWVTTAYIQVFSYNYA
jgi:hypothetical protein